MFRTNQLPKLFIAGLLLLAACSGASQNMSDMSTDSIGTNATSSESSFNDADVMFAQMMIPHHEQAIELADMALDPTLMAGEQVKTLASQIKSAQDPEIDFDDSMANRLGETAHGYVRGTRHVYGWHAER